MTGDFEPRLLSDRAACLSFKIYEMTVIFKMTVIV